MNLMHCRCKMKMVLNVYCELWPIQVCRVCVEARTVACLTA
jgi:hypothetical protein